MVLSEFFIPHGHCYLWKSELVSLHIVSDALTALAYYSIPLTLTYFVIKRQDVPFNWIFLLFSAFIVSCGTTHIIEIWTLWHPDYWLSGWIKAFAAVVSLYTAFELVSLVPQALAMPSAAQFQAVKSEIQERLQTEAELQQAIAQLQQEMAERQQAEKALRESEERLSQLTEHIRQVFWMVSVDYGQTLYVSPAYEQIWHRSCQTLYESPSSWLNDIHGEDQERVLAAIPSIPQESYSLEYRIVRPDGSIRWIESHAFAIKNEDGNVYRIAGISEDITERKLAEVEIIRSKDLLESIFNQSTDAIFLVNYETLLIQDCNQRAVELFEATNKDELINIEGRTLQKKSFTSEELHSIVEELTTKRFWSMELEYVTKKGKLFWGNLTVKMIHVADQNMNLVHVKDITERKQAEASLQESIERERAIARAIQRMRQTLDMERIFTATTSELRQLINCDRVLIYQFNSDWSGEVVSESAGNEWISLLQEQANYPDFTKNTVEDSRCTATSFDSQAGWDNIISPSVQLEDTYLQETQGGAYSRGESYRVVQDIYTAGFSSCYINLLEGFQARAYIIVPIFCGNNLWGLLATYQNSSSRQWKTTEITVVIQIGNQLGVALQQAELVAQIQQQSEALRQSTQRERDKATQLKLTLDQLRRTQAQLIQTEKMSSLGQMVAGVAHEINNPVCFILGNLAPAREYFQDVLRLIQVYQQTYPNPTPDIQQITSEIDLQFLKEDWAKLMDSMQIGAERIEAIVRSLKTFSRLNESELKPIDIHESIDNTLLMLQPRLRAEGDRLEIKVIKNYSPLPNVTCYASQLNQVFMNLLNNAIDAVETQSSPRVITICTSLITRDLRTLKGENLTNVLLNPAPNSRNLRINHQWVVIRITDNGTGMHKEVQQKMFDPFFTTKPIGKGTGLGLSISHQIIVEKHQGQLQCISAPGKGTELIVEIPVICKMGSRNHHIPENGHDSKDRYCLTVFED